jgi:integrase
MKATALTQKKLEAIKPGKTREEYPDTLVVGLRFVIQPSGATSWIVRKRIRGEPKPFKMKLGDWQSGDQPIVSLVKARELAREAILLAKAGHDPREKREVARVQAEAATANTLRNVCETYLAREGKKPEDKKLRTLDQVRRELERLVFPVIGDQQIGDIKRGGVIRLLDKIEDENGTRSSDLVLSYLRHIMNWHEIRDETFRSPIVRGMARGKPKETARTRILTDDELRAVWAATKSPGAFPALVRFLLLTACRRSEAADMVWSEIDGADWLLPSARNKTKVELLRPLSKAAQDVLAALPRFADCPYVFTSDGRRPLAGFSALKAAFDKRTGVTGATLHDLRRTARSLMSRAGVLGDHAEQCLGHVITGVRGTYDRFDYYKEKQQTYEALAGLIARITDPQSNVLPLWGKVVASGEGA